MFDPKDSKLIYHFNDGENIQSIINDKEGNVWFSSLGNINFFDSICHFGIDSNLSIFYLGNK